MNAAARLFAQRGGTAGTYTQGSTSVAVVNAWSGQVTRGGGGGLDAENCRWRFLTSDLTVTPSPGDTWVPTGGDTWKVPNDPGVVMEFLSGNAWAIEMVRRTQRAG